MEHSSPSSILRRDNNSLPSPPITDPLPHLATTSWDTPPDDELALRQVFGMVRRRAFIIAGVVVTVMSLVITYTLLQKPVYGGRFRLLIEPINSNDPGLINLNANSGSGPSLLDYATQIQVLLNPQLIANTLEQLSASYPSLDLLTVVGNISIEQVKDTKILEVRYQSENPAEVLDVLDQLAQDFLDYSLKERQTNLRQGIQFIDNQLPVTRRRVDQLQRELQVFRQQNNFIDPESQTSQLLSESTQISQFNLALDQQIAQASSSFSSLQQRDGALAALNNAPVYQDLITQLRQVEATIAAERTRFQDDSLTIRQLEERRNNLLPLLQEEAKRVVGGQLAEVATQLQLLEGQDRVLSQFEAASNQRTTELPVLIRRYTDLQRELEVATASLGRFLAARESLEIAASQREIPWQVVDAPRRFGAPISPKIPRNIMLGLIASVLLGLTAGLIVDKLDDVYHTAEDLKVKSRLPLLGGMPIQRELRDLEDSLLQERSPIASLDNLVRSTEDIPGTIALPQTLTQRASRFLSAFQVLFTKIQLLNPDRPTRSVVVSSAMAGDGKSTIALFLAQTAAEMGYRVLLVDADLRQGQLSKQLNLGAVKGLTNLIAQRLPLNEIIYQPLQKLGFYCLPTGDLPPNPAQFLSSPRMQSLIEENTKFFDFVIYDVPAMDGLADASLLAPYTDGIVLVVRLGKTERFAIAQTLETLKLSQIPVLGLVANGVR